LGDIRAGHHLPQHALSFGNLYSVIWRSSIP
jgi:hypothetical protein